MATKIVTKNSSTASAVPTASDLVQGELAVNVADKKLFTEDNSGAIIELADGVKLAGIEAGADVTDTANVTAAGALMDSELTSEASVKALNQGVATTDSPTFNDGTFTGILNITPTSGYGHIEVGGVDGAFIDLKSPSSDDYDMRMITSGGNGGTIDVGSTGDLSFNAGGSERARLLSTGEVGIGTNSPSQKLAVAGNVVLDASNAELNLKSGITGTSGAINWTFNTESTEFAAIKLPYDTRTTIGLHIDSGYPITIDNAGYTVFAKSGVEQMRLDGSGRLGIGTTSPSTKLEVNGQGCFQKNYSFASTNYHIKLKSAYGNGISSYIGNVSSSDRMNISAGGYYYGSSLYQLTDGATGMGAINIGEDGTLTYQNTTGATANSTVNPAERLRIDSAGQVGIGTASPSTYGGKLNITDGAVGGESTLVISNNNANQFVRVGINNNTAQIAYDNADSLAFGEATDSTTSGLTTERMRIDSSGNVAIGTTAPQARLHISRPTDGSEASPHLRIDGAASTYVASHWLDSNAYYIGQGSTFRSLRIYSGAETSGVHLASGGTSWGTFSDERLKYDVEPVENAVESLSNLRTVKYRLKDVDSSEDKKKLGLMAQDLVGILDEVIDPVKRTGDDTEYMSVRYTELVPVLVKAIQEQQTLIESLTARIAALEE